MCGEVALTKGAGSPKEVPTGFGQCLPAESLLCGGSRVPQSVGLFGWF